MTQARTGPAPTTVTATFIEWQARAPGPVFVNLNHLMFVHPDQQGLAVLVFSLGERLALDVSYDDVRATIAGLP